MANHARVRDEKQKEIVKLLNSLTGRCSLWEVWQDFIVMSAVSISNAVDTWNRETREKLYQERAGKYMSEELHSFARMLQLVVDALESDPDQDFLGELFMVLGLSNEWKGQFFTPYSVCKLMASVNFPSIKEKIEAQGWVSVNDPACGAGATLIAFANECLHPANGINYQSSVLFVAQDIDFLAGCMCYIQLSLLGCPGYVVIGDTLSHPTVSYDERGLIPEDDGNVWYTPLYYSSLWHVRRALEIFKISPALQKH